MLLLDLSNARQTVSLKTLTYLNPKNLARASCKTKSYVSMVTVSEEEKRMAHKLWFANNVVAWEEIVFRNRSYLMEIYCSVDIVTSPC